MPIDPIKILKQYEDAGCNLLTPYISLDGLTERHKATIETLKLSPDINDGDVYKDKNGPNFIPTKHALDKLGLLANIFWPPLIGLQRLDDGKNQDYVAYQAYGALKKADGEWAPCTAGYDIDLVTKAENLTYAYKAKGVKDKKTGVKLQEYIDYCVGRDIRAIREFKAERCESGAKNRVIRALLGLKAAYSKVQLSKPFVVIRINYVLDLDDPKVQRYLLEKSTGAQFNVFGPRSNIIPFPPQIEQHSAETADTVMGEPVEPGPKNGIEDNEPLGDDPAEDFALWDRKSQETHIIAMANAKAYDLDGMLKQWRNKKLDALDDIDLIKIHDHIKPMEDKLTDDDIPF